MLPESRNSASSTGSKTVRSSFLKHLLLWAAGRWAIFLFGKSKSCKKTFVDFKLEKNLSSELLNMDKTYDFVTKPLKKWPFGNHGKHIFFLEIEIFTTKTVYSKSLKKICRQLLSTMNVLKCSQKLHVQLVLRRTYCAIAIESNIRKQAAHWPRKPGEPGIVMEFWKAPKSQGKVKEFPQRSGNCNLSWQFSA